MRSFMMRFGNKKGKKKSLRLLNVYIHIYDMQTEEKTDNLVLHNTFQRWKV